MTARAKATPMTVEQEALTHTAAPVAAGLEVIAPA
jgi:hypothetical protein